MAKAKARQPRSDAALPLLGTAYDRWFGDSDNLPVHESLLHSSPSAQKLHVRTYATYGAYEEPILAD